VRLVIHGAPRTKKNSPRMARNKKTGASFPLPSASYENWEQRAIWQVKQQHRGPCIDCPVEVTATIYRERAVGDLINYLQAVADMLQEAGVLTDDKWVMSWDGSRLDKDAANPRVEIAIEVMQ
jgi:Holliday junction resolvase RusA-like endonuclease